MKKVSIIVLGIAIVGVAIWSGLWFIGRGQIEDTLDLELARAEARGTTITWETRDVSGFPFGYEVRASNVGIIMRETGMLIRIPEVISVTDVGKIGQIDTQLIGEIAIDLPITEVQRVADPRLPKVAKLKLTGENLLASFQGLGQQDRKVRVTADQAIVLVDQEDLPNRLNLIASKMNIVFGVEASKTTIGMVTDALKVQAQGSPLNGRESAVDVDLNTLSITTVLDMPETRNLNEILFGAAAGSAEVVYSTGSIEVAVQGTDATGLGGGAFGYSGGTATGIITAGPGTLEVRGESRKNVWSVSPLHPDSTIAGTVMADAVQTSYLIPTAQAEGAEPARLRVAVIELDLDEALWESLDPGGVLDRSKSELLLDVDATARVTGRLDRMVPGQGVPVELSNVSLNTLSVSSLGGKLNASGDVEVLQPINLPIGALEITLSNANAVLLALKQSGLIDEQMRATGAAMLQVYARPAEGEDQWETDLTFGNDGTTMNGLKVR